MKKSVKKSIILVASVIGTLLAIQIAILSFLTADNRIAESPKRIARCAGLDLPTYTVLEHDDNYGRSSSSWSWTEWVIQLDTPLPNSFTNKLRDLTEKDSKWRHVAWSGHYVYKSEFDSDDGRDIMIDVDTHSGRVKISFSWFDFLS